MHCGGNFSEDFARQFQAIRSLLQRRRRARISTLADHLRAGDLPDMTVNQDFQNSIGDS